MFYQGLIVSIQPVYFFCISSQHCSNLLQAQSSITKLTQNCGTHPLSMRFRASLKCRAKQRSALEFTIFPVVESAVRFIDTYLCYEDDMNTEQQSRNFTSKDEGQVEGLWLNMVQLKR